MSKSRSWWPVVPLALTTISTAFDATASFTADHNPLLCNGTIAGYYIRLARDGSGMTNVTGGGATVAPTFLVD